MPQLSLPRAGVIVTVLAASLTGCKAGEKLGPDKTVDVIEVSPKSARIYALGDSAKFTALITTGAGTPGTGIEVGWVSRDKSLVSINSQGVAKTLKKGGSTYIVATAGGKMDSAFVDVPANPCGTVTPVALAVGQVMTMTDDKGFCAAPTDDAEYTAIVLNSSLTASSNASVEVVGQALATPPVTSTPALASRVPFIRPTGLLSFPTRRRDVGQEYAFRQAERAEMSPRVAAAQAWYKARRPVLRSQVPPAIGDSITLNMSMSTGCSSIDSRKAVVKAVSGAAIIMEDVANPTGGFTDAEYASLAATFDTLVNPIDVAAFGAPTDLDQNSHVVVLITKAINTLTPAGSDSYVGGRTMSRDLFPKTGTGSTTVPPGCAASNLSEMFYMLAPDPDGTINNNVFDKDFVLSQSIATIAHEYQHLINFSRRMYLDGFTSDKWNDETWLHEGLSHMAEELVFHQASGLPTRSNIGLLELQTSNATVDAFNNYMIGDFALYDAYAQEASTTGPFSAVDKLSTRGATWSFLRYAADHAASTDGDLWFRLVNSGLIGQANLQAQLGVSSAGLVALLRDFTISAYADDYVPGIVDANKQPSWNMRSIYHGLCDTPQACTLAYPLTAAFLADNVPSPKAISGGGYAVFRFKSINGTESLVRVTGSAGTAMPASILMSVIRTR